MMENFQTNLLLLNIISRFRRKWFLILFIGFFSPPLPAQQITFQENFENQSLVKWTGDTGHFIFSEDGGNKLLQLNAPAAGTSQLRTGSKTAYGSWDFFIDQDFPPSNGNRGYIFLMSDREDLESSVNGYAIRTGENSSPNYFRLFRFENGSEAEEILTGSLDISGGGPFQIRVIRDEDGTWHLYESAGYGTEPEFSSSATDNTFTTSEYFGLLLNYTSTRSENYFFDDFRIGSFTSIQAALQAASVLDIHFNYPVENSLSPTQFTAGNGIGNPSQTDLISDFTVRLTWADPLPDGNHILTINQVKNIFGGEIAADTQIGFSVENPFQVETVHAPSSGSLEVRFTEEVETSYLHPDFFSVSGTSPDQVTQPHPGIIELTYNTPLTAGNHDLFVDEIFSINGWNLSGSNNFSLLVFDEFRDGDLLINEFFYRTPVSWRTEQFDRPRYVEIYNPSARTLNLRNWLLNDENISPDEDLAIHPSDYLVLTRGEPVFSEKFGDRDFSEAVNFPSLSLTTDNEIILKTPDGIVADSLHYDASLWGGNGVALERYSPEVPAHFRDNWAESKDALLGSPGLPNTLEVPAEPPEVEEVYTPEPGKIEVLFSSTISEASFSDLNNFHLSDAEITGAHFLPAERILELELSAELTDGEVYQFNYEVEDIFGNGIGDQIYSFTFYNPFSISSVQVESDSYLLVTFTQPLNISTLSLHDFELSGQVSPLNFEILNSETIRLEFSENFSTGSHILYTENIESMIGWTIETIPYNFYRFEEAGPGDILINEFLYNPPDLYSPYVELINRSEKLVNLQNWELRRQDGGSPNGGVISKTPLPLQPGEYAVVTSDSIPLHQVFGPRPWVEMSSFPAFTVQNEGAVRLSDETGTIIDSLRYDPSEWGGREVALERRSVNVDTEFLENWGESPHEWLGTPGLPNAIPPDTDPPVLVDFVISQEQHVILTFNERVNHLQAAGLQNYQFDPKLTPSLVMIVDNRVIILTEEDLADGQTYTITINRIEDLFGNSADNLSAETQFLTFSEPEPGQVVINEILYRRLEAGSPEFVEICNRSEENIDLTGWTLWDDSNSATIPPNTFLRPGHYLVLTDTESFAAGNDNIIYLPDFQSLSNNGDAVVLKNHRETLIDSVYYWPEWGDHTPGISLERRDPEALSADPFNWAPSTAEEGSTPASENSRFEPDERPPEMIFANLFHPDSLEVHFNKFVQLQPGSDTNPKTASKSRGPAPTANPPIQNKTRFLINGSEAEILRYNPAAGNQVILAATDVAPGEEIILQAEHVSDFQGNTQVSRSLPVSQPLTEGDIVINEIMYQPIAEDDDGIPDQSDYIELYNRRPYAVSLEGIFLHDGPDENGTLSRMEPVTSVSKWIPANGYVLLYPQNENVDFKESGLALFFELTEEFAPFTIRFDRSGLSLPQAGRPLFLADSTGTTVDMADYRPGWHNPNLSDTRGISLERIHPGMDSNDRSNWGSSTVPEGGTPGAENSLYQGGAQPPEETGISIEPNPFSPDGDGYDDNLFIHYAFDEPDYLLRIRIFDRYGRLVRKLADARPAGVRGSVIWDGRTDSGDRNRIGIYIIYAEAYNSASGKNMSFKKTVVLARQF